MDKCPKCGAEARIRSVENAVMYRCGTWVWYWHGEESAQSPDCRIRELTAENERLRADSKVMREALEEIRTVSQCRCDEAWTDRGRHDPVCPIDQYVEADEALKALASPPHTR